MMKYIKNTAIILKEDKKRKIVFSVVILAVVLLTPVKEQFTERIIHYRKTLWR